MLRIHTLGRLFVERDGRPLAGAAAQPRRLALLALLARAERGLTRDKLLAFLWADTDEERARRGLTQALYALRQDLGVEEAIVGVNDVCLNPDIVESDVAQFEAARAAGRLEVAVQTYGGPFLDGFHLRGCAEFEQWADQERIVLSREYGDALEGLARAASASGLHDAAVDWWRKRAALEPLNGLVAVSLMQALDDAGNRAGALQHATVYERLLDQELGAPPDPDVARLAAKLRMARTERRPAERDGPQSDTAGPGATETREPAPQPGTGPPAAVAHHDRTADGAVAAVATEAAQPPQGIVGWWRPVAVGVFILIAVAIWRFTRQADASAIVLGRAEKVTVEPGLELDPALSPDGRIVAYSAGPPSEMEVYLRLLAGGRIVPVTPSSIRNARYPRWTPDGTEIAFQSGGSIWIVPAFGGAPRLLVRGDAPNEARWLAWSPDGSDVAYVADGGIWTRARAGGPARRIGAADDPHGLAWSPDGRWLAYVDGNPAFLVGSDAPYAPINIGNLAPSSIWVVPPEGGEPRRITDDAFLDVSPVWTPDGRDLLFISSRGGGRDVYRVRLDGEARPAGPAVRLTTGLHAHTISLSADGGLLVYSSFTPISNVHSIRIPRRETISIRDAQPVTEGNQVVEGLSVSPDGRWLVYDTDRLGNQDLFKMPLPAGEPVQLTTHPGDDFEPSWSPDGREVAYHSFRGARRQVRVITADGTLDRAAFVTEGHQGFPQWSPDGRHLVYETWDSGQPHMYRLTRVSDSTWTPPELLTDRPGQGAKWSPDGRRLAFVYERTVWVHDVETGDGRAIFRTVDPAVDPIPLHVAWSSDSRTVYFKAFTGAGQPGIWSVPAAGGNAALLVRFDTPNLESRRPEIATDGERFYFTLGRLESDIWTLELRRTGRD